MKRKILGICDTEKGFVGAFSHFIQSKEGRRFDVRGFSKEEPLFDFLKEEKFDAAFVTESFLEKYENIVCENLDPKTTLILSDSDDDRLQGFMTVDRYRPAESILNKAVELVFSKDGLSEPGSSRKAIVTGVYSPIGRCGKTSLSIALAEAFSGRGSTLLLSFDAFSGFPEFDAKTGELSVSDLLFLLSDNQGLEGEIRDKLIEKSENGGLNILGIATHPEDIYGTDEETLYRTLRALKELGAYKYIVIDFGTAIRGADGLCNLCNQIVFPVPEDGPAAKKVEAWKQKTTDFPFERAKMIGYISPNEHETFGVQYVRSHN